MHPRGQCVCCVAGSRDPVCGPKFCCWCVRGAVAPSCVSKSYMCHGAQALHVSCVVPRAGVQDGCTHSSMVVSLLASPHLPPVKWLWWGAPHPGAPTGTCWGGCGRPARAHGEGNMVRMLLGTHLRSGSSPGPPQATPGQVPDRSPERAWSHVFVGLQGGSRDANAVGCKRCMGQRTGKGRRGEKWDGELSSALQHATPRIPLQTWGSTG